jgi:SAM-dependent methyltransferase
MPASDEYWDRRYRSGGTSGAGSYNHLARFKAEILNRFVAENGIASVAEFGCGDGAQLALASYPSYDGYDVSPASIDMCRKKFADDTTKRFFVLSDARPEKADLALSLDVIYHLVEDDVFERHVTAVCDSAKRFAIFYASDFDAPQKYHVRHRKFTPWIEKNRPELKLVEVVENRYPWNPKDPDNTSVSSFFIYRRT